MQGSTQRRVGRVGLFVLLLLSMILVAPATAANQTSDVASTQGFRRAVTLAGIREHQAAFQAHSDAHGGNRVAGSPGYEASASYVVARMEAAGYTVRSQYFTFLFNADATPPVFQRISPLPTSYVDGVDFASMTFSPNGDVTAPLVAVDLVVPAPGAGNGNTSGCEAADFAGFPAGAIALVQRGTCTFAVKAANAAAAGAVAVIVFNEGQPGRTAALAGTLGGPVAFNAPVIGTSFAIGDSLRNGVLNGPTGTTVRVSVNRLFENRETRNIIAETSGGDPNRVIVIGAHLDSVSRGPGVNDNGSGSATILEVAEVFASQQRDTRNKLRFIWWGAEELGLIGSNYYVSQLSPAERDAIELNLNFDMVGSPNYVRFVYDGDNSAFPVGPGSAAGPQGSGEIERVFHDYFGSQGQASSETAFSGRSDYGPFIAVGIPAGGLFTGAEGVKTVQEAAVYGGTAGEAYDRCYHLACDTFTTTGEPYALKGLDEMSDAVAHAVLYFSKRNFDKNPLLNPSTPVGGSSITSGGGGLHDDHDEPVER
jgi:Zn-dependent M28 family amino/carboxypeptidase